MLDQAKGKEAELLALLELTPSQIWNTDLENFLAEWDVSSSDFILGKASHPLV